MNRRTPKPNLPDAPITGSAARWNARRISQSGTTDYYRQCLRFVRTCWEIPAHYPTAREAWKGSHHSHTFTTESVIPLGAPVFSTRPNAGPKDAGHIFIALGYVNGRRVYAGTDMKILGGVSVFHLDAITEKWGQRVLGWTGDLNGYDLNLTPRKSD